jgi:hypothetical protein
MLIAVLELQMAATDYAAVSSVMREGFRHPSCSRLSFQKAPLRFDIRAPRLLL